MSVKKFLILTAAGIAALGTAAAQAGGPDVMAPPAPIDHSGIYADANLGWAQSRWSNFWAGAMNTSPGSFAAPTNFMTSGGNSTFTWGFDLGYQFNKYFSAELGWYRLGNASANNQGLIPLGAVTRGVTLRSWFAYFAGKVAVPLTDSFDLFGKAGIAWRNISISGMARSLPIFNAIVPGTGSYWAPFFGFGTQWWINQTWSVTVQYLHVAAFTSGTAFGVFPFGRNLARQAPSANLVVAGAGYKFAL